MFDQCQSHKKDNAKSALFLLSFVFSNSFSFFFIFFGSFTTNNYPAHVDIDADFK